MQVNKICLVGLGYVGLPLAVAFSEKYNFMRLKSSFIFFFIICLHLVLWLNLIFHDKTKIHYTGSHVGVQY